MLEVGRNVKKPHPMSNLTQGGKGRSVLHLDTLYPETTLHTAKRRPPFDRLNLSNNCLTRQIIGHDCHREGLFASVAMFNYLW